jgi:GntR family transcriptional regulator, transcriptional repressor for pyruvate dehydrogenase complex
LCSKDKSRRERDIESQYLTPISRTTLSDEIASRLTSYILEEGLKPGERLPPERELITRLSVGRSSLREALKTLSAVGAVEILGREGTFVGRGGAEQLTKPLFWNLLLGERTMDEVIEARRLVEVDLAGLAAERACEEEITALAQQLERMRASRGNADSYSDQDMAFHLAVGQAAHNRILSQVLQTMRHIIRAWIRKNILDVRGEPQSFEEHIPIFEAIARHDPQVARQAMGDHLARASARIEAGLSDQLLRA